MRRRGTTARAGFALIATLWLLVALGAVGLSAALSSRVRRQAAANVLDDARARAAAHAATEYARSRLSAALVGQADELRAEAMDRARSSRSSRRAESRSVRRLFEDVDPLEDPWRSPQELIVEEMAFGEARYAILMRDIGAALNVNEADEEMLRQFFSLGLGVDYADADRLAQAVLDWRDEDEIARINGGERDEYLEEGALVLPANRDFVEIDELRHVLGMTRELYERASRHLTLLGDGDVNVNAAPREVLLALPGMTEGGAEEILRLRDGDLLPRSDGQLREMVPLAADLDRDFRSRTTFTTDQVEILVEAWVDGGLVRVNSRVVVSRSDLGANVVRREVF
jgi:type II secretory pathway component PulK